MGSALPRGYRPDIDGLRAVAVLMVVFNHLGLRFSGGFVGVDVFFVISGYLIGSMILGEMDSGTFTVIGFYERRVRRIFPALLVVLAASCAAAWRGILPTEIEDFAKALIASLFCVSNLLFLQQKGGYFAIPDHLRALLHTWSLAVEEQFYIVFPVLLLGLRRWFPGRFRIAIAGLALTSLAVAEIVVFRDARSAFFQSPLRAWEFLTGVLIGRISENTTGGLNGLRERWQREAASAAGLMLIVLPGLFYSVLTRFPGLAAIPPCAGAALVIAAGENGDSLVGRMLSWRPVVFIGLISYSLYLWHWPIAWFEDRIFRTLPVLKAGTPVKLLVLAASLATATLSWWFVERPFRQGRFRPGRRTLFAITGSATAAVTIFGCLAMASGGFPSRFPSEALRIAAYEGNNLRGNECFDDPRDTVKFNRPSCLNPDDGRLHFLLFGDSHASDLYSGLREVLPEVNLSQAAGPSCKPTLAQTRIPQANCVALMNYIYGDYLTNTRIDKLILSARWEETDLQELGRAVDWIHRHGMEAIIIGPSFEFSAPLPRLLAFSIIDGKADWIRYDYLGAPRQIDMQMSDLAIHQWKVPYISVYQDLCGPQGTDCPLYAAPGVPLFVDTDHFSAQGSLLFARTMKRRGEIP